MDTSEFLDLIKDLLCERESTPEVGYWPANYQGENFCWDCIKAKYPHSLQYRLKVGNIEGGAAPETDYRMFCEVCHKLLQYTLTDDGAGQELFYAAEDGFDWNRPDDCYEMARASYEVEPGTEHAAWLLEAVEKSRNKPAELTEGQVSDVSAT
jgi:hypothetical protein